MKYSARHISGNKYQINLIAETQEDRNIIEKSTRESLEAYFHTAVRSALGGSANLLSVIDDSLLPYSVIGKVEFARGIGGI